MHILMAAFADKIEIQDDEEYNLIGARHWIKSEHFPAERELTLKMLWMLGPDDEDATQDVEVGVGITAPDGGTVWLPFSSELDEGKKEAGEMMRWSITLNISFPAPGVHAFHIFADGLLEWTISLEAREI